MFYVHTELLSKYIFLGNNIACKRWMKRVIPTSDEKHYQNEKEKQKR